MDTSQAFQYQVGRANSRRWPQSDALETTCPGGDDSSFGIFYDHTFIWFQPKLVSGV